MSKDSRRITYVEPLVLAACLAILAGFAYPRFELLKTQAREATVIHLGQSINSATTQAHLAWNLRGKPTTITMEGQTVTIVNGYPDQTSIANALTDYSGFRFQDASVARFRREDAWQPNNCMVTYGNTVAGSRPAILVHTSGC